MVFPVEIAVALDEVVHIARILDGIVCQMDRAHPVRKDHDGQLVLGNDAAAGGLDLLDEQRVVRGVLDLEKDLERLALRHRIQVQDRVGDQHARRLQPLVAGSKDEDRHGQHCEHPEGICLYLDHIKLKSFYFVQGHRTLLQVADHGEHERTLADRRDMIVQLVKKKKIA